MTANTDLPANQKLLVTLTLVTLLPWTARADTAAMQPHYDVIVAGAGTGGTCAAIQAARLGASVLLLEETDWIGGQMNAAAVTSMDQGGQLVRERGIYRDFCQRVEAHYQGLGKNAKTAYFFHHLCLEPRVGQKILYAMIAEARQRAPLDVALQSRVTKVIMQGDRVTGVVVKSGSESRTIECGILIDATEWGDVIPLTGARYRVGNCTSDKIETGRPIQFLTWTAVIKQYPQGVPKALLITEEPPGYSAAVHDRFVRTLKAGDAVQANPFDYANSRPWAFATFIGYRGMPDSTSAHNAPPITRTHMNFNNDYPVYVHDVENAESRLATCRKAQLRTLHLLYYIQHTLGITAWSVADDEGYDTPYRRAEVDAWIKDRPELEPYRTVLHHFPIMPYVRESRRILGLHTLLACEIERDPGTPKQFASAVALGDYMMDLHGAKEERYLEMDLDRPEDVPTATHKHGWGPFAIPQESFIPERVDGFLAAEKNISQTRLVNGATRLQPSTMLLGQAAGAIAALALKHHVQPRHLDPVLVQQQLLNAGSILLITPLRDVARDSHECTAVQLTTTHGMLQPEDGLFGPDKIVSGAQFAEVIKQLFAEDMSPPAEPITRATFAAALKSEVVKLDFVSNDADKTRPITRSEAAQIIAEFLNLRAEANTKGTARTLVWNSVRPTTPPPAFDLTGTLVRDLQRLIEHKIIDDATYWLEHAVEGEQCDGAKVAALTARAAQVLEPAAGMSPIELFVRHNVITRPDYWIKYAQPGQQCAGITTAALIASLARHLARLPSPKKE